MELSQFVEGQRLFGCRLQFQYVFMLDSAGLARRYHRRADDSYACLHVEEAIGGAHGGDVILVSVTKSVRRHRHERKTGRFCWELEWFQ